MNKAEEMYIEALFSDFLEKRQVAGEEVGRAQAKHDEALDDFISAVEADTFKEAYKYLKENDRVIKNKDILEERDIATDLIKIGTVIISESYDMTVKAATKLSKGSRDKLDAVCTGFRYGYIQGIKAAEAAGHIND